MDVICQLLPLGCIRFCACAASNICNRQLCSENVKKIEKNYSKKLFQILSTEEIVVEEEKVAKEARTRAFRWKY